MSKTKLTYSAAIKELEEILSELENADVNVDAISEKVKRSSILLDFCKKQLHELDGELEKILEQLND